MIKKSIKEKKVIQEPNNRFDMFFYIVRTNFVNLALLSAYSFVFAIPLVIYNFMYGVVKNNMLLKFQEGTAEMQQVMITAMYHQDLISKLITIPLIMIFFIGLAGLFFSIRKIAWKENEKVIREFHKGIKYNWLQFLLIGFIAGILYYIFNLLNWVMMFNFTSPIQELLQIVIQVVYLTYFGGIVMYLVTMSSVYKIGNFQMLKNSSFLVASNILRTVLTLCVALFPIFLISKFKTWSVQFLVFTFFAVIGLSLSALIMTLNANGIFDKFINEKQYPEYVNKGLKK